MKQVITPEMTLIEAQLDLLRATGDQFADSDRSRLPLPGIRMVSDGKAALYDTRVVSAVPTIIAPNTCVYRALSSVRPDHITLSDATNTIDSWLSSDGVVVGFSGYGTGGGYDYATEHDGIDAIFTHCAQTGLNIDTVVDGATGYGVPGLSGLLAQKHNLATTGFLPLRSLRGAAIRDILTVVGEEFGDEATALGAAPDVLIVFGGGPNAEKEVDTALSLGCLVVLAAVKRYPNTSVVCLHERSAQAQAAQTSEQLIVCTSIESIKSVLDTVRENLSLVRENRSARRTHLHQVLATHPD